MFRTTETQAAVRWLSNSVIWKQLTVAIVTVITSACVSQAPTVDVPPGSQQNPQAPWTDFGSNTDPQFNQGDSGSIAATLYEASLKNDFNIDTANLSYKFSYLDKSDTGSVRFINGTSRIGLSGLKSNQSGTVTLEIYEGQTLRLKGERTDVVLQPGQNDLSMSLRLIQPSPPQGQNNGLNQQQNNPPQNQETSLSIQISIEGWTPSPEQQNNTQPNNNNQAPQNPPSWDGISDIGNEDWGIESLD